MNLVRCGVRLESVLHLSKAPPWINAYISALAALGGSAVGALASFMTTWLTLNSQERASRSAREISRRENLYGEFIEEASKLYTDSLMNRPDEPTKFVRIYATANKLRLFASTDMLAKVEKLMVRLIQTYESPEVERACS